MKHIIILSVLLTLSCQSKVIEVLTPQDFEAQITNKEVQLIDVRTPDEFNSGHIKNAKNIDFFSTQFSDQFNKLNKDQPIYLYCRSGSRSRQASNKLEAMGFIKIYDLKGGILNYNLKKDN